MQRTLRQEGVRGLYKGFTPPLIGFVFMDSLLLGSFSVYRSFLADSVRIPRIWTHDSFAGAAPSSVATHFMAGALAGWTVSFIAAPIEHIKARLQVQYGTRRAERVYSGPLDCCQKIYRHYGISGIYRGLFATLVFRSFFAVFWASYDVLNRGMQASTSLSLPLVNFVAAGLAAQAYYLTGYPTDIIKQRVMTEPLSRGRGSRWRDVAKAIYRESGWRGYWRGFLPCFLRAFPANAMSIMTFEAVMRAGTIRSSGKTQEAEFI